MFKYFLRVLGGNDMSEITQPNDEILDIENEDHLTISNNVTNNVKENPGKVARRKIEDLLEQRMLQDHLRDVFDDY
jgi:hypothetical protein